MVLYKNVFGQNRLCANFPRVKIVFFIVNVCKRIIKEIHDMCKVFALNVQAER